MKAKLHVRYADTVEVIAGDAKGSRGKILRAFPEKGRVVVEGINMVWKHVKPNRNNPRGGRIEVEAPLDASNVRLLCPNRDCTRFDKPVRLHQSSGEKGKKIRCCAKCGHEIPVSE